MQTNAQRRKPVPAGHWRDWPSDLRRKKLGTLPYKAGVAGSSPAAPTTVLAVRRPDGSSAAARGTGTDGSPTTAEARTEPTPWCRLTASTAGLLARVIAITLISVDKSSWSLHPECRSNAPGRLRKLSLQSGLNRP
jgi:hypothetical protein